MSGKQDAGDWGQRLISPVAAMVLRLPTAVDRRVRRERDVSVPMDDGAQLKADIYVPAGRGPHPTVLVRSPYGRRGPFGLLLGRVFAERGYRVVVQSCRGTYGSGGTFEPHFDERSDGLATIRWIERQDWFDARLALNGPSYLGHVQWAVADSAGPALRAMCTHMTYSNITGHWYRGGSFTLDALDWTSMICKPGNKVRGVDGRFHRRRRRKAKRAINDLPLADMDRKVVGTSVPFWHDFVDHSAIGDPFWAPIDHSNRVAHVTAPVLQVGGWYDLFLPLQLTDYRALEGAGIEVRLVIGPWTHTSAQGFASQITESLRWLDRHLRRVGTAQDPAPVQLFVMGADRWRSFSSWPPDGYRQQRWHLHADGMLRPGEPTDDGKDGYLFDPSRPTPVVGGTLLGRGGGRRKQRRRENRPDVLVYTSDVLTSDVELIGDVTAEIHVSANIDDFDIFVRLCDVNPQGHSFNVCDGIERISAARHPRPAGGIWTVQVSLWPTAYRLAAGHRIRVQVASGAHPRFVRNLGSGAPLATATTMKIANLEIHRSVLHPSAAVLPVAVAK